MHSVLSGLQSHLRKTFRTAVAAIYTAGAVFHVARIAFRLTWQDMPFLPDWILVFVGSWGLAGLVLFARQVDYRGKWEVVIHWLIVAHLAASVILHLWILIVGSHRVLAVFSLNYSYFGFLYFAFFAWRSWTMRISPRR